MKKIIVICFLLLSNMSFADARRFGLGFVLGDPTAITAKYWLKADGAVDFGLSFGTGYFLLYVDYNYHFLRSIGSRSQFERELSPYVGVGGIFVSPTSDTAGKKYFTDHNSRSAGMGIRIPVGLEWLPTSAPIGIFLEIAPGIGIFPNTFGFFNFGIGGRYYF